MRIVVLISGRGSNLQAILAAQLPAQIVAVISNKPDATGLQVAQAAGIATQALAHTTFASRAEFDKAMIQIIDGYQPDLVVLAGYMRILTDEFVNHYQGRLLNIHPSLLPSYAGLNTHQRALDDGVKVHGCTVHFVTPTLDHGPIIIQAAVPVLNNDNADSLSERVLCMEHQIYPTAIHWFIGGRIQLAADGKVNLLNNNGSEQTVFYTEP
ncbi:phosphoribosylglycinamide formyltransferase [Sulfuriferula nivalis]|uniref:Phosphoribosylglycinamide formyltransferase n=1 Tax=Sulfuriferula nivalis TaxID=2675298 RepID=A0A809RU32_9PROT|nr:phosphoribosylglycinamide formyltransferase [Sulfuriferula nivalis]BBP02421.1 phosphoribosylglycinamide formyltransferase [Sulfuriferula nivalis]